MKYLVVIEPTETGYFLPTPQTYQVALLESRSPTLSRNMREAIVFYLEGLKLEGLAVP